MLKPILGGQQRGPSAVHQIGAFDVQVRLSESVDELRSELGIRGLGGDAQEARA